MWGMKYVYMIRSESGLYKIGVAAHVTKRVSGIQTSNPDKLEIVSTKLVENAENVERAIHQYLHEHKMNGGREWFKLTPEQALEVSVIMNQEPVIEDQLERIELGQLIRKTYLEYSILNRKIDKLVKTIAASDTKTASRVEEKEGTVVIPKLDRQQVIEEDAGRAIEVFRQYGRASTSLLQRKLRIGYSRASRIMDYLQEQGSVAAVEDHPGFRVLVSD